MKSTNIFTTFLTQLGVKHTNEYSNKVFNEHPHKYNLLGLSTLLSDYNIENEAYTISDKEQNINKLPVPFIAHFGGGFVVVEKIKNDKVTYKWNEKNINLNINEFCESWSGAALFAETNENSQESEYKQHIKNKIFDILKFTALAAVSVLIFAYALFNNAANFSWWFFLSLILNLFGIYICWLLLQKQMNTQSKFGDKICSLFSQSDCNDILESEAAKLFGLVSWSEIGLGYFISSIIILLFAPALIVFYVWIAAFSLFYTVWSIWYQKFKAKQWCALCLIVQVVFLLIVAVNLFFSKFAIPEFSIFNIIALGCVYLLPTLIICILVPRISNESLLQNTTQELNSIKANEDVFRVILTQQPKYEVDTTTSDILFGNPDAEVLITILTNPHCYPCGTMHTRVEKLLAECGSDVCIQYIFSSFEASLDDSNRYLTAVYYQYDKKMQQKIYNEWFEKGSGEKENFFMKYPVNINEQNITEQFTKHEKWKADTKLRATPTILVNGYKLPDNYKIEDLRFLLNFVL